MLAQGHHMKTNEMTNEPRIKFQRAYKVTVQDDKRKSEHRLCDRAVDALLHSKDLVEVQRAGIIIREVNCGIGRRLMENE
jgi:hypothetical protein